MSNIAAIRTVLQNAEKSAAATRDYSLASDYKSLIEALPNLLAPTAPTAPTSVPEDLATPLSSVPEAPATLTAATTVPTAPTPQALPLGWFQENGKLVYQNKSAKDERGYYSQRVFFHRILLIWEKLKPETKLTRNDLREIAPGFEDYYYQILVRWAAANSWTSSTPISTLETTFRHLPQRPLPQRLR